MFILAIFLHFGIFITLGFIGKHSFNFLFPDKKQPIIKEEPLNYVLVDDDLVDEQIKEEAPKALGKTSRQSRDTIINPDLPKLGPSSSEESSVASFDNGMPLPESIATPEITPTPPPIPEVKPKEALKPIKPIKTIETIVKPDPVEQPQEKLLPNLPELELQEDLAGVLPKIKKPEKVQKTKILEKEQVPGINSSDQISKIKDEVVKKPEISPQPKPRTPSKPQEPVKPQHKIPIRKIPVRKIGSTSSSTGGKIQKRLNTSAINAGSKSIAVLRSRYGDYMDKILRRIQQAITIQQQINPISIHEGSVVMSFTINPSGILDQIKFIDSAPQGITTEVSAARGVLTDVQNSGPFEPPTEQMLNDPDFQDIIINFVFESR